ncbi:selenoprotein, putative [Plasmodium chabaudi chabaudi]|nr:selenoprotein, putative [Plasmodium chabaudi chabaudi]SCM05928.1 selenoprotein, putative [Plasmodium chabaudi chabaudi]SCM11423.1 selenoprotein, putative [Plasmodium chabaudi adami]
MNNNGGKNDYESILENRKLKYENLRRNNSSYNKYIGPIINLFNGILNFLKQLFNILAIFFRTLFGMPTQRSAYNGKGNDNDNFYKKPKTGNMGRSRITELKNISACLGST